MDLNLLLKNGLCCQKRTGNGKKFTVYYDNKIIKGPYTQEATNKILDRFKILQSWNTQHLIHPSNVHKSIDGSNNFIEYPNMGLPPITECLHEINKESFSEYSYNVLQRTGLFKLSDQLLLKKNQDVIAKYATSVTSTLLRLIFLGVGDSGFFNVLVSEDKQRIYVIDIDDNRDDIRDSPFFYCSKDPSSKYSELWKNVVDVNAILDDLEKNIQPKNERYNNVINMFKKYYLISMSSSMLPMFNIIPMLQPAESTIQPFFNIISESSSSSQQQIVISNQGSMQFKGIFSSITFSNYPVDEIKSGLQKYVRGDIVEKALICGFEMYRFKEFGTTAQVIVSNVYNRIGVIAPEDIGPANINLALNVINYVLKDETRDPYIFSTIIKSLCVSKKTRLLSHFWRAYVVDEGIKVAKGKGIQVDSEVQFSQYTFQWLDGDPKELVPIGEIFYQRLNEGNSNAFHWLGKFMDIAEGKKMAKRKGNRKTKAIEIIWIMLKLKLSNIVYDILSTAYSTFSEKRPFIMLAVYIALFNINTNDVVIQPFTPDSNKEEVNKILEGKYTFKLDDYVIDMHTKAGREKGMNRTNFVKEGAVIANSDPQFETDYYKTLRDVYNSTEK
jgi:hypothetical protein